MAKRSAQAGWVGRAQGLGVAASSVAQAPSLRAQERRVATLPCDPHEIAPAHRTFFFFFTARVDARRCTPIHVTPSHDTDAAWSVLPLDSSHLDWWVRSVGGGPAGDPRTGVSHPPPTLHNHGLSKPNGHAVCGLGVSRP